MTNEGKLILVGVISAAHGIRGDVAIKSFTTPPENILRLELFNNNRQKFVIKKRSVNSRGHIVCQLEGCSDRDQAIQLRRTMLYTDRSSLPRPQRNEFYFEDLVGCKVIDISGKEIGTIINVANYGAGDIVEIQFTDNSTQMYPFTKENFPEIGKRSVLFAGEKVLSIS